MQTIAASVILEDAYRKMGWDPDLLEDVEKAQARMAFSEALQHIWESWWWNDLMQTERVAFAPEFRTTDTPTEGLWPEGYLCYEPISNWYYVCIKPGGTANPPIDPAAPKTATGDWNILLTDWARWCEPHDLTEWEPGTATTYNLGDQTQRKGIRYQSIVADNVGNDPENNEAFWLRVPDWELELPYKDPGPGDTVNLRGPFGTPKSFSRLDPKRTANPGDYHFEPSGVGNRVIGLCRGHGAVWGDIRRSTPVITGNEWDPGQRYQPVKDEDVIYDQ